MFCKKFKSFLAFAKGIKQKMETRVATEEVQNSQILDNRT